MYELVFVGLLLLLLLLLTLITVFTIIFNGSKLKVGVYQVSDSALLPKKAVTFSWVCLLVAWGGAGIHWLCDWISEAFPLSISALPRNIGYFLDYWFELSLERSDKCWNLVFEGRSVQLGEAGRQNLFGSDKSAQLPLKPQSNCVLEQLGYRHVCLPWPSREVGKAFETVVT